MIATKYNTERPFFLSAGGRKFRAEQELLKIGENTVSDGIPSRCPWRDNLKGAPWRIVIYVSSWCSNIFYEPLGCYSRSSLTTVFPRLARITPTQQNDNIHINLHAKLGTRSDETMKRWSYEAMRWSVKCFIASIFLPALNSSSLHCFHFLP